MAEIDNLSISIKAQATTAANALDNLVTKLGALSNALAGVNGSALTSLSQGINDLSVSMNNMNNVKTADFTRLTKNLENLGKVNVASLNTASGVLGQIAQALNTIGGATQKTEAISNLAKALSKLGGASIMKAQTNLPVLSRALVNMMRTLTNAPAVSNNLINMTNALANLASQGQRISSASRALNSGMRDYTVATTRAKTSTLSLAAAFGKFYATYFLAIRGIKSLWKSIEGSMDYVETFNYLSVTMDKLGSDFAKRNGEYGEESAEAYAEAFTKKLNELTAKMTGYNVGKNGELVSTNMSNLGLDPEQLMNYQAKISAVTNSVGLMGETSINTAKALSMLSADISSLTNTDLDVVMNNLSSGLIGMSRAVYKYGYDLTNATLSTYALANGISKNVSEMTQAEKMQLRIIALLDQSKIAWGDQANTINSVANQYRVFQQQIGNLGRIIGNVFLPVVQMALPIINGFIIVLQRLFTALGFRLYGDSWLTGLMDGISGSAAGAEDLEGSLEDSNDALENMVGNAKKLQTYMLGIDELNVIDPTKGSGSAGIPKDLIDLSDVIANAVADYESVWNRAFDKMQNRAILFADKIEEIIAPLKKIFDDLFAGDFFQAGFDTSMLIAGIFNWFADAIASVNWREIGKSIGEFLAGIDWVAILKSVGRVIWEALNAVLDAAAGLFSAAPLEATLITLVAMPGVLNALSSTKIVTGLAKVAGGLKKLGGAMSTAFKNARADGEGLSSAIGSSVAEIRKQMSTMQKAVIGAVAVFAEFSIVSGTFYNLVKGEEDVVEGLGKIGIAAAAASAALYLAFGPAGLVVGAIAFLAGEIKGLSDAFFEMQMEQVGKDIYNAFNNPNGVPVSELTANLSDALNEANSSFDKMKENSSKMETVKENVSDVWLEIDKIKVAMDNGVISVEEGKEKLATLFGELATLTEEKFNIMTNDIMLAYGENGVIGKAMNDLGLETEDAIDVAVKAMYNGSERAKEIAEEMATLDWSNEEDLARYAELQTELAQLSGYTESLTESTEEFTNKIQNLQGVDLSELFGEDGTLDAEKLREYLTSVSDSLKDYETTLDEEKIKYTKYWEDIMNAPNASAEDIARAEYYLSNVDDVFDQLKKNAEDNVKDYLQVISDAYSEGTENVFKNAESSWENMDEWEKMLPAADGRHAQEYARKVEENTQAYEKVMKDLFKDISDTSTKEAKISAAESTLAFYKEFLNIETDDSGFADSISRVYGKLMWNGLGGLKDDVMEIAGTLPESFAEGVNGNSEKAYSSVDDMGKGVTGIVSGLTDTFTQTGKDIVTGLITGIEEKRKELEKKVNEMADAVKKTFSKALEIHSPSRVFFGYGENTIEGYQLGMENLYDEARNSLRNFALSLPDAAAPNFDYSTSNAPNFTSGMVAENSNPYSSDLLPYLQEIVSNTRETADSNREIAAKDMSVRIGDRDVVRAYDRGRKDMGLAIVY